MKKIYTTFFASVLAVFAVAQNARVAAPSVYSVEKCKSCTPSVMTIDTTCNFNATDTLTIYYGDMAPHDSGWSYGHNAYTDMGWAERYDVSGSASVIGGAYKLFQIHGASTSTLSATAAVYSPSAGHPGTSLGSKAIPYASMTLNSFGANTYFAFTAPIAVTDSFYMSFELGAYTFGGADTIALISNKSGERTTTNPNQNLAKWSSDSKWHYELTENFGGQLNFGICPIMNVSTGVENYVSKGDLKLFAAYPNPSADIITFNYALNNFSKVTIEIFDAQGKSMMKIAKGNLSAGNYNEKVNLSSFGAGSYFYSISAESGTIFSKFAVVK